MGLGITTPFLRTDRGNMSLTVSVWNTTLSAKWYEKEQMILGKITAVIENSILRGNLSRAVHYLVLMEIQLKNGIFEKSLKSKKNPKEFTRPVDVAAYAENQEKMRRLIQKNINAVLKLSTNSFLMDF